VRDGEDRIHQLLASVALGERGPRGVADERLRVEFVGRAQEAPVEAAPPPGVGFAARPRHVGAGQSGGARDRHVRVPHGGRAAERGDAEDQDFAIAGGQRRLAGDVAVKWPNACDECGVIAEGVEIRRGLGACARSGDDEDGGQECAHGRDSTCSSAWIHWFTTRTGEPLRKAATSCR